jgi:titin
LGDLNGDGRLDIATANFNSGNASVLLNSIAFAGQTAAVVEVANTPTFGTPTARGDGFTVQISNYNGAFTYGGTATAGGTVAISNTGLVTVSGVAPETSSTATITTTRTGYANGSGQVTATSSSRPTIDWLATLRGGRTGTPFVMTYATLQSALKVANGVSIVIQSVQSGVVQKWSGTAWVTVSTAPNASLTQRTVSAGDKIRWVPPAGVSGDRLAFKAKAWDGSLYSLATARVTINLTRSYWF